MNLTLTIRVLELAEKILETKGQASLSSLVEELIRNDYERRMGILTVPNCASAAEIADQVVGKAVELVKHQPSNDAAGTHKLPKSQPPSDGLRKKGKKDGDLNSQAGSA